MQSVLVARAEGPVPDRLLNTDKIWFKVKLTTLPGGTVLSLYEGYKMDVQLTAQITYGL